MCDGRPFASPLFRRLAGRGAIVRGFPFRWALHLALSLTRCLNVHDATACHMENSLYESGRPYDDLSCLFFTALWLQRSQSILVQENQPVKDIDLTCFKTFPFKATTCSQVAPMSLDWPLDAIARFDQSRPSSSPEGPYDEQQPALFQLLHVPVGGKMLFKHLKYYKVLQVGTHVVISLMEVCDVLLGTPGVSLDRFFPRRRTESPNSNTSGSSLTTTTSYVSRMCMEKMSISRLFRCWLRGSGFLVPSFLET